MPHRQWRVTLGAQAQVLSDTFLLLREDDIYDTPAQVEGLLIF